MIEVKISIPEEQAQVLSARALAEGYPDIAGYIHGLIAQDVADPDEFVPSPAVLAALEEGERSGISPRSFDEIIAEAKREFGIRAS